MWQEWQSNRRDKRRFWSHLYIKCIFLPRQARDKHRKKLRKEWCVFRSWLDVRCIASGQWTYKVDFNTMTQVKMAQICFCLLLLLLLLLA
eukprot:COSAG06_NODE_907_length_11611_cov_13.405316_3_plen_90_part_00